MLLSTLLYALPRSQVTTADQVYQLMAQGQSNRAVGAHSMNADSSRSHSILTLTCRGRNKIDNTVTFGMFMYMRNVLFCSFLHNSELIVLIVLLFYIWCE